MYVIFMSLFYREQKRSPFVSVSFVFFCENLVYSSLYSPKSPLQVKICGKQHYLPSLRALRVSVVERWLMENTLYAAGVVCYDVAHNA